MAPSQVYSYGAVKGCRVCFPGPVRLHRRTTGFGCQSDRQLSLGFHELEYYELGRHETWAPFHLHGSGGLGVRRSIYSGGAVDVAARLAPEYNSLNSEDDWGVSHGHG